MSATTTVPHRSIRRPAATGIALAAGYGAARVALRARRAWRNKTIIESVDTGSVWTTHADDEVSTKAA
jgi:hypothetical protein